MPEQLRIQSLPISIIAAIAHMNKDYYFSLLTTNQEFRDYLNNNPEEKWSWYKNELIFTEEVSLDVSIEELNQYEIYGKSRVFTTYLQGEFFMEETWDEDSLIKRVEIINGEEIICVRRKFKVNGVLDKDYHYYLRTDDWKATVEIDKDFLMFYNEHNGNRINCSYDIRDGDLKIKLSRNEIESDIIFNNKELNEITDYYDYYTFSKDSSLFYGILDELKYILEVIEAEEMQVIEEQEEEEEEQNEEQEEIDEQEEEEEEIDEWYQLETQKGWDEELM